MSPVDVFPRCWFPPFMRASKKEFSRSLRANQTEAEGKLWSRLRNRQLAGRKFRRQHPIGGYVADFACLEAKVVIELDGGQHSESEAYDERRTREFEACGFLVLRFWNNEVLGNIDGVLDSISRTVIPGDYAG